MAEPEESPSSLAELEALAGLDGAPVPSADDATVDDSADFDLSRLAASAAVGGAVEAGADDDRLDLGIAAANVATPATTASTDGPIASSTALPVAAPSAVSGSRGSLGFVLGLAAGIGVAGVLFLSLRTAAPVSAPPSAPVVPDTATKAVANPTAAATAPSTARAASHDLSGTAPANATPTTVTTSVATPRAVASGRPAQLPTAPSPAGSNATRPEAAEADPTRPPADVAAEPTPAPEPARPIDSLLDDALGSGTGAKQRKAAHDNLMGEELPATPTAADVTQVIQVLLPAIRGCAMGQSGVANTLLVVRNDGGVANASITGAPYAGAASGRCMEGVLRRAKFPRFRQSVFRVQFPLSIRASS